MNKDRIELLRKKFATNKINAFLVSSPVNIEYLTGYTNFSRAEREAYLFITLDSATLFTDERYIETVEKTVPPNIKATINRPHVKYIKEIVDLEKIKKIGIETNFTVYELEEFEEKMTCEFILQEDLVEGLRLIKDNYELSIMKQAAELTDKAFSYILKSSKIKVGVTEKQIAWEIEKFIKENGGTLAFESIVAFGPNSSIPHHSPTNRRLLKTDEFIKLDFGAKFDGYCCDMTRTLLTKTSSDRAKKIYTSVLTAQKKAADSILSGVNGNAKKAASVANDVLIQNGFDAVPHGLGHGIGLEVHEKPHLHPKLGDILTDGMVFSIEPGIYMPGFGGVRIEDTVTLNKGKTKELTKSPKNLTNMLL